jgi:hypothetical protein
MGRIRVGGGAHLGPVDRDGADVARQLDLHEFEVGQTWGDHSSSAVYFVLIISYNPPYNQRIKALIQRNELMR